MCTLKIACKEKKSGHFEQNQTNNQTFLAESLISVTKMKKNYFFESFPLQVIQFYLIIQKHEYLMDDRVNISHAAWILMSSVTFVSR